MNSDTFRKLRTWRIGFQKKIAALSMSEFTLFSFFSIITGAIVGLAAVSFHEAIGLLTELFFDHGTKVFYFLGGGAIIIIPVIGMLIQALMTKASPKTAKKKGVSEVIKAVAIRGGYIPFRTTLFHFIAPAICMGSGGTVGPEGPAAQIGGGMASKFGQLFGLSDSRRRMFTAAGAGAAISAVFNTPLGGIFFALEIVLLNDFQTATFSALILSSVTASAISRIFLGNSPAFVFSTPSIGPYSQFYLFAILGLLAGLLSIAYLKYSATVGKTFGNAFFKRIPRWALMAGVGLIVGVCGFFFKDILGIGYPAINKILASSITWEMAAILLVLKFLLVPLILNSGGFGGVFAPSLFIGAGFGYLYALAVSYFWGIDIDTTTYVLVGMGAMLGGINSIPISSILIIFEMTKDYTFILPLMLAVVLSTTIVQLVMKGAEHVKHLEKEGYHISSGRDQNILRNILVRDAMKDDVNTVSETSPLSKLISKLLESPHSTVYTTNQNGELTGTISENELRPIITEYDTLKSMLVASDIARPEVITVSADDDLDYVLKLFGSRNLDQLPVHEPENTKEIIGTIRRQDVITSYNRESLRYNITDGLAKELKSIEKTSTSKVAAGYSIVEKIAPDSFVGKTLVELKIRNKLGLEVLMIKQTQNFLNEDSKDNIIIPDPKYKIQTDDTLVFFGADEKIEQLKGIS